MLVLLWLPTVSTVTDCGGALGAAQEVIRINTNCKSWCASVFVQNLSMKTRCLRFWFSAVLHVHVVFDSDSFYKISFTYNGWI